MKRPILIAGNWKMNHDRAEAATFAREFGERYRSAFQNGFPTRLRAELYVPLLTLEHLRVNLHGTPVELGAQNVHWEAKGAFTGEISTAMLTDVGTDRVLVGHSERRQYFAETDATVKKRTERALAEKFQVIFCLGETRAERESGATEKVLETQLSQGLPTEWNDRLILAYEPVWAIGTGLTATPEQAESAHAFTRKYLCSHFSEDAAEKTPILYGGSVTPENARSLLSQPNVDGGLVGGASLKPESFLALLQAAAERLDA